MAICHTIRKPSPENIYLGLKKYMDKNQFDIAISHNYDVGTYAAKLVLAIIEGIEDEFQYEEFACKLIHRQSTQ